MKRILFVFSREASFIAIDQALLEERWAVTQWRQEGPVVNLPKLVREVARSDLVFGWFASWHTFLPVALARLMRKPTVVVIGGFDTARMPDIGYGLQQRGAMRRVSGWVMRLATRLVTNSYYSREEAAATVGLDPARVTVVYHGVPDPFGDLPDGERERVALTVGIVDRANLERKGLRSFVQAAAHLPDVSFVLAGRWDDAGADELREQAPPNVTLTGWVEQEVLNEHMRRASVYVQASAHEGFGMSVAEAMLAGDIPVTTRAGALPEVVGDAGVLVEDADPEHLAEGIEQALVMDEGARRHARRRVLERFGIEGRRRGLQQVVAEALGEVVSAPVVNLFSDTQTQPSEAMRQAMAHAEVGDEQRLADPTVNALQERVAELLGHEAALFLPSGTMCNAIAFRLHLRPGGDEAILDRTSHPVSYEAGGPAALSGGMLNLLDGDGGIFTAAQVEGAVRPAGDRYGPRSRLVSVEQTTNVGGGRVWPLDDIRAILDVAARHDLRTHLDGARLMNAAVASRVPAAGFAGGFDTAWVDFTKGLGAPVGAVLAASRELIDEAWRYKQMMGGAMRQAGILAAAGLYALDHNVARLAEDHAHARRLAEGLAELPGVDIDVTRVETNIVVFGVTDAFGLCGDLYEEGVQLAPLGPRRLRAVTHLDVSADDIERALTVFRRLLRP